VRQRGVSRAFCLCGARRASMPPSSAISGRCRCRLPYSPAPPAVAAAAWRLLLNARCCSFALRVTRAASSQLRVTPSARLLQPCRCGTRVIAELIYRRGGVLRALLAREERYAAASPVILPQITCPSGCYCYLDVTSDGEARASIWRRYTFISMSIPQAGADSG